jgi:uncharacterized membrane protein YraQ (UPF0718 family)
MRTPSPAIWAEAASVRFSSHLFGITLALCSCGVLPTVLAGILVKRATTIYLATIAVCAVIFGLIVDYV